MKRNLHRTIPLVALALLAGACSRENEKPDAGRVAGAALFKERCRDCHKVRSKGGVAGPDLSGVGAKRNRPFLQQVIREPFKPYPGTIMPHYDIFSVKQIEQLVDYLSGLK
jgi:L-cysteine S-thiosulfotransferase